MGMLERVKRGWSVFRDQERPSKQETFLEYGPQVAYNSSPTRIRAFSFNERSILASIYNRIAIDVSSVDIRHVRLNDKNEYQETINSGLNHCLHVEANIDQAATQFKQDMVMSLLEAGVIAVVPVNTTSNPNRTGSYEILDMRVGTVTSWYPGYVTVNVYDERDGLRKDVTVPKSSVAIIENPLYTVMNEPNSTYQRLLRKLNWLDVVDEQSSSGKLDILIKLPYTIKSETRQRQAEARAKSIEMQLKDSKYGIAYIDGAEQITQLNRPSENNLLKQVEYLTSMLYGQLGVTEEVILGTATEEQMINYRNRTLTPILTAIVEAMRRTFLTKTARAQGQDIRYYQNLFNLVTPSQMAELGDKYIRNEIVTPNELRGFLGMRPSTDPKADELRNPNMPIPIEASEEYLLEES